MDRHIKTIIPPVGVMNFVGITIGYLVYYLMYVNHKFSLAVFD
jgi:hypothetical protein